MKILLIFRFLHYSRFVDSGNLCFILRRDQVSFLVYGRNRSYFKQKQKYNITKFWPTGLFLIYYFLFFLKKKEIKHNKLA